jgi:hypothetical protein
MIFSGNGLSRSGSSAPGAIRGGRGIGFVGWISRKRNPTFVSLDAQHRKSNNSGASAGDERLSDYACGSIQPTTCETTSLRISQ